MCLIILNLTIWGHLGRANEENQVPLLYVISENLDARAA